MHVQVITSDNVPINANQQHTGLGRKCTRMQCKQKAELSRLRAPLLHPYELLPPIGLCTDTYRVSRPSLAQRARGRWSSEESRRGAIVDGLAPRIGRDGAIRHITQHNNCFPRLVGALWPEHDAVGAPGARFQDAPRPRDACLLAAVLTALQIRYHASC